MLKSSSTPDERPPQHQVFINFRGELRLGFVSHLVEALEAHNINVFFDNYENRGEHLENLLTGIEKSRIAVVIFSEKYTESEWCLRELAKIKECVDEGKLVAIPIFYKVEPSTVKGLTEKFGDAFRTLAKGDERKKEWKEALKAISKIMGTPVHDKSPESKILKHIVEEVKKQLTKIPLEGSQNASEK